MCRKLICFTFICVFAWAQETRAGLVGWWKLDEGSGQTTADSSGNGLDGTLTAPPGEIRATTAPVGASSSTGPAT
jgi:hypothetical protein